MLIFFAIAPPALAHPHIFIDARATIVFDAAGAIAAIRHEWTFDEGFSAWSVQGLDTDNDGLVSTAEMQELADENMEGLAVYDFYTYGGEGDVNLAFAKGSGATLAYDGKQTTLRFTVAVDPPYSIRDRLELAINDPEYYVAITFAGPQAVTLENAPPGCTVNLEPPHEMDQALADRLYALPPDVTRLPDDLAQALRGVQGAIILTCPSAGAAVEPLPAPQTAIEAAATLAGDARPAPFGGPPPEPGLNLPRTGILGWIYEAQRDFYIALSEALGRIRADGSAFWVLGGLSFLYGVFHAAGPGHGKVVISSYVLASESQIRRGVVLSFLSALLQSTVAVVFVLAAAALLRLSSLAMSAAANWIGIASYGLVAALGAWLLVRHLLLGHRHGHRHGHRDAHDGHHAHGHHHDGDEHGHGHVVTADQARGNWREQLAVVLGVGLRPCSGALVVLAFALSLDLVPAGIAAVYLMGLGTAITVAVLAALAASAKGVALRFAAAGEGTGGSVAAAALWWLELLGAVGVLAFGLLFLLASL